MRLGYYLSKEKERNRCRIPYHHDFPDRPCLKCHPVDPYDISLWSPKKKAIKLFGLILVIVGSIILIISTP